jgi:hypothetical protein
MSLPDVENILGLLPALEKVRKRILTYADNYYGIIIPRKFNVFNIHWSLHLNNISIHIQQDTTLLSLFYLETALHVSGGTIIHHQERK